MEKRFIAFALCFSIYFLIGFASADLSPGNINSCGTLSSAGTYTLTTDLQYNETCFWITGENVTLNGGGYSITGNLTNPFVGIYVLDVNAVVQNFSSISSYHYNIFVASNNLTVSNVNVTSGEYGLSASDIIGVTIENANFSNNSNNLQIFGTSDEYLNYSIDFDSVVVDGNKKVYWNFSLEDSIYEPSDMPDAAMIFCGKCNNVTFKDFNLSHSNSHGLLLYNSTNSTIYNVTSNFNSYGIFVLRGEGHNVSNNFGYNNSASAVFVQYSDNNVLFENTGVNNGIYGFILQLASNNTISNGNYSFNQLEGGLLFTGSTNNSIINNTFVGNKFYGFALFGADYNNIIGNVVRDSSSLVISSGFFIFSNSAYNFFTNNSLYSNSIGYYPSGSENNVFLNDYINGSNVAGIYFSSGSNNTFENINITDTNSSGYDIDFFAGSISNETYFVDSYFESYNFYSPNNLEISNSTYGSVKFLLLNEVSGTDLFEEVVFSNNSIFVNTSLSSTMTITLKGIGNRGYTNASILRNGELCSICSALTSLTAENVRFTTSSSGTYSIGNYESPVESTSSGGSSFPVVKKYAGWTYVISDEQLANGYYNDLEIGDRFKLSAGSKDKQTHYIYFNDFNDGKIAITVESEPQNFNVSKEESQKVDLDGDGIYDLAVYFLSRNEDKARIFLKSIVGLQEEVKEEDDDELESELNNSTTKRVWIFIVIVFVVLALFYAYNWNEKRKIFGKPVWR